MPPGSCSRTVRQGKDAPVVMLLRGTVVEPLVLTVAIPSNVGGLLAQARSGMRGHPDVGAALPQLPRIRTVRPGKEAPDVLLSRGTVER